MVDGWGQASGGVHQAVGSGQRAAGSGWEAAGGGQRVLVEAGRRANDSIVHSVYFKEGLKSVVSRWMHIAIVSGHAKHVF